jgi:hypothetical protein
MKSKLILFAIILLLLSGCKNNPEITHKYSKENLQIEICGEVTPNWLLNEINGIVDNVDNFRPIEVFFTNYENTEYVIITDIVNNTISGSFRVFLCSGTSVQYGTDTYVALQQIFIESRENFTLLWSNSNTNN